MLYLECKPDMVLVQTLTGLGKKDIIHDFKGKHEVLRLLSRDRNSIALVEEDPGSDPSVYLASMRIEVECVGLGLQLRQDPGRGNRAIVLRPKLEEWVIRASSLAGLNMSEQPYNLPSSPRSLHKGINNRLDKVQLLVEALLTAQSPRILKLRQLLTQ